MPSPHAIPPDRAPRRRLAAITLALAFVLALPAQQAQAWGSPTPFYIGAARDVFAVAGDPAGNAFAIINGESLDKPLLLIERWAAAKERNEEFIWRGADALPGNDRFFTNALRTYDSFQARAAGDGIGLIVWRVVAGDGTATLRASLREPPLAFSFPLAVTPDAASPRADPSPAINASADVIVALRYGRGKLSGRAAYVRRRSPGKFGIVRTLSASATSRPAAAIGGDGTSVVAWVRGTRVEARRVDAAGKALKTERLGSGQSTTGVSVAASQKGAAIVAWRDAKGALRAARRTAPGKLGASRAVRTIAKSTRVDGLTAGIDPRGRAWVAWRELAASTRRVRIATALPGGAFKTTQLGTAKTLGIPSLATRPGGGAVVAWRSTRGWRARTATAKAVFADAATVSKQLVGADLSVARAATLAGPGSRVDLVWPQNPDPAETAGALIYNSSQDEDTAPGQ